MDILQAEFGELHLGEARDSAEVLARLTERKWSLLLLDVVMPGRGVLDMLGEIRRVDQDLRILILTVIGETEYAVRMLKAGANGYITKQHASDELISAVHKVLGGGTYLTNEAVLALATGGTSATSAPHEGLSQRELEVLQMLARGKTVKEIAYDLSVSAKTIATYITRIREKTGLQNYVEMTRYALQHRLVD